ncbi:MAG: tetratricopeptide repeat protein [Planctomycetes bacterium]|nr:tetratricopeptide repeat protein [Planctomycetota bacterium]MBL7042171.1 tetratricopeptide repeat protein [Pirellulaceae bacterium]
MRWHPNGSASQEPRIGEKTIDAIEKGDLLTVLEEREDTYLVVTYTGGQGTVSKVNAARLSESVVIYDQLIKENADEGRLYALRAAAWWARGEEKRALKDFDRAIRSGYTRPDVYADRGLLHILMGHHDKALADHTMAIKLEPKNAAHHVNRAGAHMAKASYKLAVEDYSKAIDLDEAQSTSYQQRAVAWKLLGDKEEANADFSEAIKRDPKSVPALLGRGFLWFEMDMPTKAVTDFSEVIKLAPNNVDAYNNRGFNRRLLGDDKSALSDFEQAIRLAPDCALAHQNKAWLLASANDVEVRNGEQAVKAATRACELQSYQDVSGLKALAAALAEDGQFEKAVGWQEKVIEMVKFDERSFERELADKYHNREPFRLPEPDQVRDGSQ